jgi:hypothetical protein
MEAIAKVYQVKFVLNIAQLGEDDPLWRNVSIIGVDKAIFSFSFRVPCTSKIRIYPGKLIIPASCIYTPF